MFFKFTLTFLEKGAIMLVSDSIVIKQICVKKHSLGGAFSMLR